MFVVETRGARPFQRPILARPSTSDSHFRGEQTAIKGCCSAHQGSHQDFAVTTKCCRATMESSFQDIVLNDLNKRKDFTRRQRNNIKVSDFGSSCHLPMNLSGLVQKHFCKKIFVPMFASRCSASCCSCFWNNAGGVFLNPVWQLFNLASYLHISSYRKWTNLTLFFLWHCPCF